MRTHLSLLFLSIGSFLALSAGCGGSGGGGTGGDTGGTGASAGDGGATTTTSSGGSATGGSGGAATGGSATGGSATGGSATGGSATGGSATGGSGGAPPDGFCRTEEDCPAQRLYCFPPGQVPMCGICFMPDVPCGSDMDCAALGPTSICGIEGCFCSSGCIEGCTMDAQCAYWESCAASHHCEPKSCAANSDCPANFQCSSGACARKTCGADADCDDYCVLGSCYPEFGVCSALPA